MTGKRFFPGKNATEVKPPSTGEENSAGDRKIETSKVDKTGSGESAESQADRSSHEIASSFSLSISIGDPPSSDGEIIVDPEVVARQQAMEHQRAEEFKHRPKQKPKEECKENTIAFDIDDCLFRGNARDRIEIQNMAKSKNGMASESDQEAAVLDTKLRGPDVRTQETWRDRLTELQKHYNIVFITHNDSNHEPFIRKLLIREFGEDIVNNAYLVCKMSGDKNPHLRDSNHYFRRDPECNLTLMIDDKSHLLDRAQVAGLIVESGKLAVEVRDEKNEALLAALMPDVLAARFAEIKKESLAKAEMRAKTTLGMPTTEIKAASTSPAKKSGETASETNQTRFRFGFSSASSSSSSSAEGSPPGTLGTGTEPPIPPPAPNPSKKRGFGFPKK